MSNIYIVPSPLSPVKQVISTLEAFLKKLEPVESKIGVPLVLHYDKKSEAYYVTCHVSGETITKYSDLEATLGGDEDDELYKLNREITEDKVAYQQMEQDALAGRSFEDIVAEYDTSYRSRKPIKIYGGQHRVRAISKAFETGISVPQGVRVYFALNQEQKVEIAIVNNTSIAVSNDLLDRMREQMIGSELRGWCQNVGLLPSDTDFADKRSPDIPTVRIARTLIVNYIKGINAKDTDFHQPVLCKSGGVEEDYEDARKEVDWSDARLIEMGEQFARLHKVQSEQVKNRDFDNYAEFARKAFSYSIVAGWAYAAGLFQQNSEYLNTLYSIADPVQELDDPLSAKALSEARLKGVDPDTYRGLGTRSNPREFGRVLELFIVLATKASKKLITKKLANAAIQSYEAKRSVHEADKALGKI